MHRGLNPITLMFLLIVYLFSLFSVETLAGYGFHFLIVALAVPLLGVTFSALLTRIRPVLYFLPLMTLLYCLSSILMTSEPFSVILGMALLSALKILLMVMGTVLFLERVSSSEMIDSLRTLWSRRGLKWRWMEDLFQLLDLSMRFFPMVSEEVKAVNRLEKALSLAPTKSIWAQLKKPSTQLPTLVATCIHRAEQIGDSMAGRGYGKVVPRSVSSPVKFKTLDGVVLMALLSLVVGRTLIA